MFCDIRGFTSIVESQPPEVVIELLNTYYTLAFDAIGAHGGVVNQMIGDGLMALFRRNSAAGTGRAPRSVGGAVQPRTGSSRQTGNPHRRGHASGSVVAGYTGTEARATYTCVGDAVNLAARLEAHTKEAGRPLLVDAATSANVGEAFASEPLGRVFKGKAAPVEMFAVTAL